MGQTKTLIGAVIGAPWCCVPFVEAPHPRRRRRTASGASQRTAAVAADTDAMCNATTAIIFPR